MKPFLKWPGGKRWLAPYVRRLFYGRVFERYMEPFLGGGALFFELAPEMALLSDVNSELINAYCCVRDEPEQLAKHLRRIAINKRTYLAWRRYRPRSRLRRAVRLLYLSRTAFAGMY